MTLLHASIFHQLRRDSDSSFQRLRAAEIVAAEQRLALPIDPRILRGAVLSAQGVGAEAVVPQSGKGLSSGKRRPQCFTGLIIWGSSRRRSRLRATTRALWLRWRRR